MIRIDRFQVLGSTDEKIISETPEIKIIGLEEIYKDNYYFSVNKQISHDNELGENEHKENVYEFVIENGRLLIRQNDWEINLLGRIEINELENRVKLINLSNEVYLNELPLNEIREIVLSNELFNSSLEIINDKTYLIRGYMHEKLLGIYDINIQKDIRIENKILENKTNIIVKMIDSVSF